MTAPVQPAELAYGPPLTCELPSLHDDDQVLPAGTEWTCPECGSQWMTWAVVPWCGVIDVEWKCNTPAPADWSPPAPEETP